MEPDYFYRYRKCLTRSSEEILNCLFSSSTDNSLKEYTVMYYQSDIVELEMNTEKTMSYSLRNCSITTFTEEKEECQPE